MSLKLSEPIWRACGCSEDRAVSRDLVGRACEMESRGTKAGIGGWNDNTEICLVQDLGLGLKV